MDNNIEIRLAQESDYREVNILLTALNRYHSDIDNLHYIKTSCVIKEMRYQYRRKCGVAYFLAHYDKHPCGILEVSELQLTNTRRALKLDSLFVLPEYRGNGVATELLKKAEEICDDGGMESIILNVAAFNEGAIQTYEHFGFKTIEHQMEFRKKE